MQDGHGALRQLTMDCLKMKTAQHHNFLFPGQNEPQMQNNHEFLQIGWKRERDIVTELPCNHQAPSPTAQGGRSGATLAWPPLYGWGEKQNRAVQPFGI